MIIGLGIVFFLYLLAIIWMLLGIQNLSFFKPKETPLKTTFSIVIPFRNEEKQLPLLIRSIQHLNYDPNKFEILFVDDASEDRSVSIIKDVLKDTLLTFKIISNKRYSNAPKKDAISLAVKKATNAWIITTDADCQVPPDWLLLLDAYITQYNPEMVCMPVLFEEADSLLAQFQFLDGLSLQATTKAGFGHGLPLLCNGANLAYKRTLFFEVAGYVDNDQYASGDDVFLMEKIKVLYPKKIHYLKTPKATVITQSVKSWREVIQQRIRWASKTKYQKNKAVTVLGSTVLLANMGFIASVVLCFIYPLYGSTFLGFILFKIVVDALFLHKEVQFFNKKIQLFLTVINAFIYPFIMVWVAANSIRGNYNWKGRSFKK
ncbi:MAG: glycosyltransferase [Flavobacteriaceae bacterium]